MDRALLERASHPELRIGRGLLAQEVVRPGGRYALVSQPEVLDRVPPSIVGGATAVVRASSLEERELAAAVAGLSDIDRVVGIGGGMAMDAAKYMAWRRARPLLLAPSIISVDASVSNTVALRREGRVVYDGFVVAESIVADLELISSAPPRLNRAGVGDLLSIQTGRFDWALGARAGRIAFDPLVDAAAAAVLERLYGLADDVAAVTDRALESILRAYVEVNALLLAVGHSGPEEGSEHYVAYAVEAHAGRSFVHGELIGLGVVLMSGLQGEGQAGAVAFLDRCRVAWRPADLGLDRETLRAILVGLPRFVRHAGLPCSIIDEARLDAAAVVERLLDSIPSPARGAGAPSTAAP
jgi:glycerol-1-phosphate dehydrogenase [NAD(P)+]